MKAFKMKKEDNNIIGGKDPSVAAGIGFPSKKKETKVGTKARKESAHYPTSILKTRLNYSTSSSQQSKSSERVHTSSSNIDEVEATEEDPEAAPSADRRKDHSRFDPSRRPADTESTPPPSLRRPRGAVTLIHTREMPSYSAERYYMLSEIEQHSHSVQFLKNRSLCPPPFLIYYYLWKPGITPESVGQHIAHVVLQLIRRRATLTLSSTMLLEQPAFQHYNRPSSPSNLVSGTFSNSSTVKLRDPFSSPTPTIKQATTSLYLVVDKISTQELSEEEQLIQQLLRLVASQLRSYCEGMTVGLSNHVRAAPGLEVCMNAFHYGAPDRRRRLFDRVPPITENHFVALDQQNRSIIGLLTDDPESLVGLSTPENEGDSATDAVQGVNQRCFCAEWNGCGDLHSFAKRAHLHSRLMSSQSSPMSHFLEYFRGPPRKIPRRIVYRQRTKGGPLYIFLFFDFVGKMTNDIIEKNKENFISIGDSMGWLLLCFYVVFHSISGGEVFVQVLVPEQKAVEWFIHEVLRKL